MTNLEHLIENAIFSLEGHEDRELFLSQTYNIEMSKRTNISLEDIWEIAQYVVYTYRPGIVWDTEDRMVEKYGYKIAD